MVDGMPPVDNPVSSSSKPWGWAWFGWSVLVTLCLAAALVADVFISFGDGVGCGAAPTEQNLRQGQLHLLFAAGVLACPWVFATVFSPRRWPRMLLGCGLGLVPLAVMSLTHLHPHDWTGGFCF